MVVVEQVWVVQYVEDMFEAGDDRLGGFDEEGGVGVEVGVEVDKPKEHSRVCDAISAAERSMASGGLSSAGLLEGVAHEGRGSNTLRLEEKRSAEG